MRLSEVFLESLAAVAEATDRSVSWHIEAAICEYLDEMGLAEGPGYTCSICGENETAFDGLPHYEPGDRKSLGRHTCPRCVEEPGWDYLEYLKNKDD